MPQTPPGQIFSLSPSNDVVPVQADRDGNLLLSQITIDAIAAAIVDGGAAAAPTDYETVAASQTDQVLGATGAVGDILETLIIVPATTAAGAVNIKDGGGSNILVFVGGGTTALIDLAPKVVRLGAKSTAGAWKVSTGANVTVIAVGDFT